MQMGNQKNKLLTRDYQVIHVMRERGMNLLKMGRLTISQQTLAEWCGCSLRTIQASLTRLQAAGYLTWTFNYRKVGRRVYRCANSYYLLQGNWRNLLGWVQRCVTRKPRKPLESKVVHATVCATKTDIYKKRQWTSSDLCGLDRSEGYIAAIMALPDR